MNSDKHFIIYLSGSMINMRLNSMFVYMPISDIRTEDILIPVFKPHVFFVTRE